MSGVMTWTCELCNRSVQSKLWKPGNQTADPQ